MHMIIRVIVYALNPQEAKTQAKKVFADLCGEDRIFDYYHMFDDGHRGSNPVAIATSSVGKTLINEGMRFTKDAFRSSFKRVRKMVLLYGFFPQAWKRLFAKDKAHDFRYPCYLLGQYDGSEIWLYDHDGSGIREDGHLKNTLEKWKCLYEDAGSPNPYQGLNVYVVPADVHY